MSDNIGDKYLADCFGDLLQVTNANSGVDATLRVVADGEATDTPLYLSTTKIKIKPSADSTTVFEVQDEDGNAILTVDTTNNKITAASGVTWEGNGASLTGIADATGGISNTASTNIVAAWDDPNPQAVGNITLTIGITDLVQLLNNGSGTGGILQIAEQSSATTPDANWVGLHANNKYLHQVDEDGNVKRLVNTADWQPPLPAYIFDGSDDYVSVANDANLSGETDFTLVWYGKVTSYPADTYSAKLLGKGLVNNSYGIQLRNSSGVYYFDFLVRGSTQEKISYSGMNTDEYYLLVATRSGTTMKFYVNSDLVDTHTIGTDDYSDTSEDFVFGYGNLSAAAGYLDGSQVFASVYNLAFTQAEIDDLWNNGEPQKAEIEYKYKGGNQTALTSGTLEVEKEYIIDTYVAGDDFTNVGGTNVTGNVFTATGTTPTTWTNSSSLRHIGNVLDLKAENAGSMGWFDASGNGLHGVTSGDPITPQKMRDYKSGISITAVEFVNSQKSETIVKGIIVTTASGSPTTVSLGTTTSANEILNAQAFTTGDFIETDKYSQSERSLFAKVDAGTVDIIIIYEKVAQ